jgi:hypothetical protein
MPDERPARTDRFNLLASRPKPMPYMLVITRIDLWIRPTIRIMRRGLLRLICRPAHAVSATRSDEYTEAMMTTWSILFFALAAYGQTTARSIQGRAVDDIDMKPIERVKMVLTGGKLETPAFASGDDSGRFRFDGLPAGVYWLTGEKAGFGPQPQQEVLVGGQDIILGDVVFTAMRFISGTVRWSDGEPVAGAHVYPLLLRDGSTVLPDESQMTRTSDQGMFRISGLAPGRYVVYSFASGGQRPGRALPVFYPGGDTPDLSRPLDLRTVAELSNIPLVLNLKKGIDIQGKVGSSASFRAGADVYLELLIPGNPRAVAETRTRMGETFQFANVPPGSYLLVVSAGDPGTGMPRAVQSVVVGSEPVRDLVVAMPESGAIRGKVEIVTADGKRVPASGVKIIGQRDKLGFYGFSRGMTNDQGEFQMPTAIRGETYTLRVEGLPARTYVAAVRQGEIERPADRLSIAAGQNEVSILLQTNGGRLNGRLKSANPTRSIVLLIPRNRAASNRLKSTNPTSNGSFQFDAIAPGDYDLVALDGRYISDLPTEEALRRAGRVAVTIRPNDALTIDLQLIRVDRVVQ